MLIISIVMKWKKIREQEYVMLAKISAKMLSTFSLLLLKKPLVRSGKFVRSFVRTYIKCTYVWHLEIQKIKYLSLNNFMSKKFDCVHIMIFNISDIILFCY